MNNYTTTDGFNERTNYIHNANDINNLNNKSMSAYDNSLSQMRIKENMPNIKTSIKYTNIEEAKKVDVHSQDSIVRNINMSNVNKPINTDNPVSRAINMNRFKNKAN